MTYLLHQMGKRLRSWVRITNDEANPPLPEGAMLGALTWWSNTTLGLLKAQNAHELLKLKRGDATMSDADLTAELESFTAERLLEMPQEELDALIARRDGRS